MQKDKFKIYLINLFKTTKFLFLVDPLKFVLTIFLNILSGLIVVGKLWVWKFIVDSLVLLLDNHYGLFESDIILYFSMHFLLVAIEFVIDDINSYTQNIFGQKVDRDINKTVLKKIEDLEISDFEKEGNYNTIQKANEQTLSRSVSLLSTIIQGVKGVISVIGTAALLFNFSNTIITLTIICTIPLFFVNNKIYDKWYEIFNSRFEKIRFANQLKQICLKYENIKELKVFSAFKHIRDRIINTYDNNILEDKKIRLRFSFITSSLNVFETLLVYFIKIYTIIIGIKLNITIGTLVTYLQSIDVFKNAVSNLLNMISQTYDDSLYMENLFNLLEIESEKKGSILINSIKKIEFLDVSFKYNNTQQFVLKNFSFVFEVNNSYGIIGLNGSGKTTLIKLLIGLYEIEQGKVLINGININDLDKEVYRQKISAIFQDFIKYPFNVKENIVISDYAKEYNLEKLVEVTNFSRSTQFINALKHKYETRLGKEWSDSVELSLGQWQKLAVSRAVFKNSDILILDEPTASLDAMTEYNIFKKLKDKVNKRITILVTHRMKNVCNMNMILVLKNGKLVESGTYEELIKKKGEYYGLYRLQEKTL